MKYIPMILTLWILLLCFIKGFSKSSKYGKVAIFGFTILIIGTSICDEFTKVLRHYEVRGEKYTQTVGDLIYYLSIDLAILLLAISIRSRFRFEKLVRSIMQLLIDYLVVDMVFLLRTNPYVWNKSKISIFMWASIAFVIVYYFTYIALWHHYWVEKFKIFYHGKFKRKNNGRS